MESPPAPEDPAQKSSQWILAQAVSSDPSEPAFFLLLGFLLLFLLLASAFFSASENAFFSLSLSDLEEMKKKNPKTYHRVQKLLGRPKELLATILVGNNLANIALIIVASSGLNQLIDFQINTYLEFPVKVLLVTFLLLVFGEVIPKTYATHYNKTIASMFAVPLDRFRWAFYFIIYPLSYSVSWFDKMVDRKQEKISAEELSDAIDLTVVKDVSQEEKSLLKGIVNFGSTEVRQIMTPRVDVVAVDFSEPFLQVLHKVKYFGFSRMPVYKDSFDVIEGLIYIKDLLPYVDQDDHFAWQELIKPPLFVPETKKIDDLLKDFQEKRVHMALVVDEYGGKQGIVTMEDILEEIFGEINDEFDDNQPAFIQPNDTTFILDAKTLINDFCRITQADEKAFEGIGEEVETLGGVIMELAGRIPFKGYSVTLQNFRFTVLASDTRRIKKIKAEIISNETHE